MSNFLKNENSGVQNVNTSGTSSVDLRQSNASSTASLSPTSHIPRPARIGGPPKHKGPEQFKPPTFLAPQDAAHQGLQIAMQALEASKIPDQARAADYTKPAVPAVHVPYVYHVNEKPGDNPPERPNKLKKDRHFRFTDMMTISLEYSISIWKKLFAETERCVIEWLVMGLETCPTTKKLHLQGALYYTNPRSMKQIQKELAALSIPLGFLAKNDGTPLSNRQYCLKGDVPHDEYMIQGVKHPNYGKCQTPYGPGHTPESRNVTWWEFGKCPMQGERTDIEEVATAIKDRKIKSKTDLFEQYPVQAYKFEKGMMSHINMLRPPRTVQPAVHVFNGESGAGKSYEARLRGAKKVSICGDYKSPFLQGWDGEDCICLDEWNPNQCSIEWFLNFCDIGDFICNTKNGEVRFTATEIYINTNVPLEAWWPHASSYQYLALQRRILDITEFKTNPLRPTRKPMKREAMVDYSLEVPKLVVKELGYITDEEMNMILELRAAKQAAKADKSEALQDVISKQVAENKQSKDLSALRQSTGNPSAQLFTSMADQMSRH